MKHIKSATNSRNESLPEWYRNKHQVVDDFCFLISFEADPNGNGYFTRFDISMEDPQKAIDDLESIRIN